MTERRKQMGELFYIGSGMTKEEVGTRIVLGVEQTMPPFREGGNSVSLLTFSCNAHLNHQREFNTKGHSSPLNRKIEGQGWAGKCGILELLTGEGGAWGMLPQPSLAASQM